MVLKLDILLNNRDFHQAGSLTSADDIRTQEQNKGRVVFDMGPALPRGILTFSDGVYTSVNQLRGNLAYYLDEAHRGETERDTCLHQGSLVITLAEGAELFMSFSLEDLDAEPHRLIDRERVV